MAFPCDSEIFVHESVLGSDLAAVIVYPDSPQYEVAKLQFETSGHAFLIHEQKMIVVDGDVVRQGWFTGEHLDVIFAHELGHFLAEHAVKEHGKSHYEIEREADFLGASILKSLGMLSSYNLHAQEYEIRYGSTVDEDFDLLSKKVGSLMQICANA
tara:strand:+ start:244 stop:711 length:468 start_codon:yes stop_codon:yes gene_type:complete